MPKRLSPSPTKPPPTDLAVARYLLDRLKPEAWPDQRAALVDLVAKTPEPAPTVQVDPTETAEALDAYRELTRVVTFTRLLAKPLSSQALDHLSWRLAFARQRAIGAGIGPPELREIDQTVSAELAARIVARHRLDYALREYRARSGVIDDAKLVEAIKAAARVGLDPTSVDRDEVAP